MNTITKFLIASAALLLLSACETPPENGGAVDGAGAGYDNGDGGYDNGYGADGNVLPGSQGDLEANIGDRIFFAYDSSALSSDAQATLERQAEWMKQYPNVSITVEGHCDERGTREYNLALGERRAAAVKGYLVSLGVNASRVMTISYGKERPAVLGANESAWSQNRRGVTVVSN